MKVTQLRQLIREEIESISKEEEIKIDNVLSKSKAFHQLKPFFVAKVKGFKPGIEKKFMEIYNSLLAKYDSEYSSDDSRTYDNSDGYYNLPRNPDFFKNSKNNEKIVKASSPKDVENKVWMYYGTYNEIPIEFKDLEYNLYQVNPQPQITQLK
jgi:hypothetical protein